jgi:hypothetical protein
MTAERIINSWIEYLELRAKSKTGLSSSLFIWGGIAFIALLVTVFFLGLAVFIWLADRLDPLKAALIMGGAFLLLLIISVLAIVLGRRATIQSAQLKLAQRRSSMFLDASMLTTGLEIGRAIGWRRIVPLVGVVLLAAGLARDWRGRDASGPGEGG